MEEIKIKFSNRKTLGLTVDSKGVTVRAPYGTDQQKIDAFVSRNTDWIEKNLRKMEERRQSLGEVKKLTREELEELADRAVEYIPQRVAHYAAKLGVTYGRITIRNQKTRWGSCSSKGNLNFNCLLMLTPPEVIDAVVVHELWHRKVMNHSAAFYKELHRVYPDYDRCDRWLKEHGPAVMARMLG